MVATTPVTSISAGSNQRRKRTRPEGLRRCLGLGLGMEVVVLPFGPAARTDDGSSRLHFACSCPTRTAFELCFSWTSDHLGRCVTEGRLTDSAPRAGRRTLGPAYRPLRNTKGRQEGRR